MALAAAGMGFLLETANMLPPHLSFSERGRGLIDHCEVGATGRESFPSSFRAVRLQGAEDDHIGGDEDKEDGPTHHPTVEHD